MTTDSMTDKIKQQGNEAFSQGNYEEAIKLFSLAIDSDPSQHVLWSNRSAAYASTKSYKMALEDAEMAIKLAPNWSKGYGRKAAALMGMSQWTEAKNAYQEGLNFDPTNEQLKQGLEKCNEAIVSQRSKPSAIKNPFATPDLFVKLSSNPKTAPYLSQPGFTNTLNQLQKSFSSEDLVKHLGDERVLACLGVLMGIDMETMPAEKTSKQEPQNTNTTTSNYPAPEKETPKIPKVEKDNSSTNEQKEALKEKDAGNNAYKAKDFETALKHYQRAFELDPKNVTFLANQAAVYFEQGNWDACIESCLSAVEVGREQHAPYEQIAKVFLRAGSAYEHKEDLDFAIKYYNKSLAEHRHPDALLKLKECEKKRETRLRTEYHNPELAEKERDEGNAFFKEGKFAEAITKYTEAIKRDEKDVRSYSNRCACYTKLGAVPEAIKDAETCIKLDPTFIKAYIRKANAELLRKDPEAALKTLQEASLRDTLGTNAAEIQQLQSRCFAELYKSNTSTSAEDANLSPEERAQRAIERDPELQNIVSDPAMRIILQQMQTDPQACNEHMRNPAVATKIRKLIAAGIIRTH